ncbi:hypothetical protein DL98DRAFT_652484 [Cadophora sp. DSE1049]|nr:hypothetical protein DL98DRAFT_652484 [Cadophora sp. DSE1049]
MDPVLPVGTELEGGSGFNRSQTLQLEILKENISEKYGTDANLVEEFLKAPPGTQWPIFTLLYPKVAFLIDRIVDVIREVDKLFTNEYDLKLYGIESSLLYPINDHIDQWRERFDDIIAAGPSSLLWDEVVWEFKDKAQKAVGGSLIDEMDSNLAELPDRISSKLKKTIGYIKVRFEFLGSRMIMVERCETEHRKESQGKKLRRRKPITSQISSNSNQTEAESSSVSSTNDRLTETEEDTIGGQTTALELPRPAPNVVRTHGRRLQPVYPILPATSHPASNRSLFTSHRTNKWQVLMPTWSFLGEKTTVLCLLPSLIVISAILFGVAITRSPPPDCVVPISNDENFFSNISQTILSLSSLYCTLIPLLRNREVPLNLFWFRTCLSFSAATGVASVATYTFQWQSSLAFGFLCSVFQVFATLQLIEGLDATIN